MFDSLDLGTSNTEIENEAIEKVFGTSITWINKVFVDSLTPLEAVISIE